MRELLDQVDAWFVFVATVVVLTIATEVGFRVARADEGEGRKSHLSTLLTDMLLLLGFLLGFSFSITEGRFSERKALVLDEANAISTTYLRAQTLPPPQSERVRKLLREYVAIRLTSTNPDGLEDGLHRSGELHDDLWDQAVASAEARPTAFSAALFETSLNDLINLHHKRVIVGLHHRLPGAILVALYVVAILSMALQGYAAGLTRTRMSFATLAVLVSIALVLVLIVDLDRPWQSVFKVSDDALHDVQDYMDADP